MTERRTSHAPNERRQHLLGFGQEHAAHRCALLSGEGRPAYPILDSAGGDRCVFSYGSFRAPDTPSVGNQLQRGHGCSKPHMGMVSCIGISFFVGSMVLPALLKQPPLACMEFVTIPAFVLAGVGAVLDWVRRTNHPQEKMNSTANHSWQPMPGGCVSRFLSPFARRGCTLRSA